VFFFGPVPDGPGLLALFRAPLDRFPEVSPVLRGALVFEPLPLPSCSRCFATFSTSLSAAQGACPSIDADQ
jgi:hypothetical protein